MRGKAAAIDSLSNPRIKRLLKEQRKSGSGLWMIEGWKLLREAVLSEIQLTEIYVTREALLREDDAAVIDEAACPIFVLPAKLMKKVSNLENSPGVLAVGRSARHLIDPAPRHLGILLLSIRDPGNFGTIIRTAEATSCDKVAYTFDCVDPHQTKVIRASMGSVFRTPLVEIDNANTALEALSKERVNLYALSAASPVSLFDLNPAAPSMILIGSEATGLPSDLPESVSRISIPMAGKVESLNAAMAAAVALYHFSRTLR